MRVFLIVLTAMIFSSTAAFCQAEISTSNSPELDKYPVYVGAYLGVRNSLLLNLPTGRTVGGVNINLPSIGATAYVPFAKKANIGFMLNLGYEPYGYTTKPYDASKANNANTITEKYGYFCISPMLYLSGFVIGFDVGSPLTGSAKDADGNTYTSLIHGVKSVSDLTPYMSTMIEAVIGGNIFLYENETGRLTLDIHATYAISGLYTNYKDYAFAYDDVLLPGQAKSSLNPKPLSLSLGVSYLFKFGL